MPTLGDMNGSTASRPRHWLASSLGRLLDDPGALDAIPAQASVEDAWREASALLDWSPDRVAQALAERFRLARARMDERDPQAAQLLPETVARRRQLVPLRHTDRTLVLATSNPLDMEAEQEVGFLTGRSPVFEVATPEEIRDALRTPGGTREALDEIMADLSTRSVLDDVRVIAAQTEEEISERELKTTPVVRLTNLILQKAVEAGATDIHMEPERDGGRVRFRVDGVLQPFMTLPLAALIRVVSRIKILAELDIADRVRPQDGRMRVEVSGRPLDLRISTVPVRSSEKVVIRILDPEATFDLQGLGLGEREQAALTRLLGYRNGIVLVTGPTGSGKTTTLYAALTNLSSAELNISTVEQPVEYELRGISQIQVEPKKGVTFASALRALLRQDPDVILVGEIRDEETAEVAAHAAMTGHQVLSTLHTNDALGAVSRLEELGLDRSIIAATLRGVVAQRLLRKLCPECSREVRSPWDLSDAERALAERTGVHPARFAPGCAACGETGFRGRTPLVEILEVDRELARGIAADHTPADLRDLLEKADHRTLWDAAMELVRTGTTSLLEVERVVGETGEHEDRGAPAAATPTTDEPEPKEESAPRGTVLVVDDDAGTRTLIRATLTRAGFQVVEAADGDDALDVLGSPGHGVELVTLDLDMPRVGGLDVLRLMREDPGTMHIPVVVATHSDDQASELELLSAGADDYMVKPIDPVRMLGRVQAVLRRHRLVMTGK